MDAVGVLLRHHRSHYSRRSTEWPSMPRTPQHTLPQFTHTHTHTHTHIRIHTTLRTSPTSHHGSPHTSHLVHTSNSHCCTHCPPSGQPRSTEHEHTQTVRGCPPKSLFCTIRQLVMSIATQKHHLLMLGCRVSLLSQDNMNKGHLECLSCLPIPIRASSFAYQ